MQRETGGFSVPVLASQVVVRLHPIVLYAAPFLRWCTRCPGQIKPAPVAMGKAILGCRYQRELKHHVVSAQCGWELRLGTCLLLEVAMSVARVRLLPLNIQPPSYLLY